MNIQIAKVMIALLCIVTIAAFPTLSLADETPAPFMLWEVPYGHDASDVALLLELDHGIRFSKTFYAPTDLTPEHTKIDSSNDEDISLFGLPFHLSYDDYYDSFVLTFSFIGSWDDRAASIEKITDGLFAKYGSPDRITVESEDHALITATPADPGVSSLAAALACLDLGQLPSDGRIFYRIVNIVSTIKPNSDLDASSLVIEFRPEAALIKGDEGFDTF